MLGLAIECSRPGSEGRAATWRGAVAPTPTLPAATTAWHGAVACNGLRESVLGSLGLLTVRALPLDRTCAWL